MIIVRKLSLLAILVGLTYVAHMMGAVSTAPKPLAESTLSLGFLLLFAFLLGRLALIFKAPMITGYLVAGVISGPYVLGLVTELSATPLRLVDNLALALIAFAAGGELKIEKFKTRMGAIVLTALTQTLFVFSSVFIVFAGLFSVFLFPDVSLVITLSAAMLLGVVATANSPATAIAVITETRSQGLVPDTILAITVFKDVFVITLFGLAVSVAGTLLGAETGGGGMSITKQVAYDTTISLLVGALAGAIMISYLKIEHETVPLFMVGMGLVMVEVCHALGVEPLLASITAGFVVENFSKEGEKLIKGLETSSLPIFVVFFSLAGQGLNIGALFQMWPYAIILVAIRMAGTWLGSIKGLKMAGEEESVGRYAWTGFIGQAGVSLGFAVIIGKQFPGWGAVLSTLIVASVVINQLIGPILMKRSLMQANEALIEKEKE